MASLFEPLTIGPITLKNRVVLAPLTRMRSLNGIPTDTAVEYYGQRSTAGLVISEGSQISELAAGYGRTPGIYSQQQAEGWKKIAQRVHDSGSFFVPQLWHCGLVSVQELHPFREPASPSDLLLRARTTLIQDNGEPMRVNVSQPKALTIEEIQQTIADYQHSTTLARDFNADLVEVHAAHGYLLQQFQSPHVNNRTDAYGGSIENRARLTLEAVDAAIAAWDSSRVGIRISPVGKLNAVHAAEEELTLYLVEQLAARNIAYLHISEPDWVGSDRINLALREKIRERFTAPIIAAGNYTLEKAQPLLEQGLIDAVAFGRPFIANPDLPYRLEKGLELNEPRPELFYGFAEEGYIDYPTWEQLHH